jgi:hypothetical protein
VNAVRTLPRRLALALVLVLAWGAAACDPVHSDAVSALGGEAPGVRTGPLHRPGQPCLLCHDGAMLDPPAFSIAGTVFLHPGDRTPVDGARVTLTDVDGKTFTAQTNQAGNFYVTPGQFTPHYPMIARVSSSGLTVSMNTLIGEQGSCNGCHVDPAGAASPGHVSLELDDGGTPP